MTQIDLTSKTCSNCPIRPRAICSRCTDDELVELDKIKYYKTYPAGASVVLMGDPMTFVASVVTGVASLSRSMVDGRMQMVGLLLPSDFIGRPGRETASFDVTAVSELTLCHFHKRPFERVTQTTPHVQERLVEIALDELDAAREWMLLLGRKTAREKIASFLLICARRLGRREGEKLLLDLPLTRDAMSDYLGLTIETVSRQMAALKRDGVLVLDGTRKVTIPDLNRLLDEAGDDSDGATLP
ncbi:transcriptional regulator FnrL [Litoreibacter janthinus]|uniref:CRP/FNR family transcriptional regulator, anaerobic regulatory protein n=1 Tax=Litoreibacter janthinus TaxID=670154 RepID=A0A1I6FQM2_9RHOB|nr:Crp/Fnr family transcriptional regulator [Litoreibacter janthinus]SFR32252.1 CRP/FNR family transcriptional regulator, anaerobic regulatory protein [Litoreibacter janthinus]